MCRSLKLGSVLPSFPVTDHPDDQPDVNRSKPAREFGGTPPPSRALRCRKDDTSTILCLRPLPSPRGYHTSYSWVLCRSPLCQTNQLLPPVQEISGQQSESLRGDREAMPDKIGFDSRARKTQFSCIQ